MKPEPITFTLVAQVVSIFAVIITLYKAYQYSEKRNNKKIK